MIENKIWYDLKVKERMRRPQTGKQQANISQNISAQKSRRSNKNNCQWIYEAEYRSTKVKKIIWIPEHKDSHSISISNADRSLNQPANIYSNNPIVDKVWK